MATRKKTYEKGQGPSVSLFEGTGVAMVERPRMVSGAVFRIYAVKRR